MRAEDESHDLSVSSWISESREELEKLLEQTTTASSKERLKTLYLLKSDQVTSRQGLAELIGRDQAIIPGVIASLTSYNFIFEALFSAAS